MTRFCTDTIQAGPHLRPTNGVLRAPALAVTGEARHAAELLLRRAHSDADATRAAARAEADALLAAAAADAQAMRETAEAEAAQVREAAETEAREVRQAAQAEAQHMTAAEQQRVLEQSGALLDGLKEACGAIVTRVDDIAIELAQKLFDRLVSEVTPRERIAAALKCVILEAPPKLVDSLLRVHPEDVDLLPEVDWPVKPDPSITRGACRLEATNGQWCANFDAAIDALKRAFQQGVHETQSAAASEVDGLEIQEENEADAHSKHTEGSHSADEDDSFENE